MTQQSYSVLAHLVVEVSRYTEFRHTTLGRTPLDEGSARRRDLYLTTLNIHKKQTWGFEPAIPASDRPQTYALRPLGHRG